MQKKYTLPRHTNLATQSSRIGAFFIDLACLFVLFLVLFYGCSAQIFFAVSGTNLKNQMSQYTLDSNLLHLNEKNEVVIYNDDNYDNYERIIPYYYLNYLTGNVEQGKPKAPNYDKELEPSQGAKILPIDYYTVFWYNQNVLKITDLDPDRPTSSSYFTYVKDEFGNYDKTQIGVPRTERYVADKGVVVKLTVSDITQQYKAIYEVAYRHLENQDFYLALSNPYYMGFSISAGSAIVLAGAIIYILFPLIFKKGQTIAIVGETGAGKSTIVNLMCRFYEPTGGHILIDGKDYKERSINWLHSNLGYVMQTPHLFSGTIKENIRYGNRDASDEQIYQAAKLANAEEFILKLENGYDTEVGEGGNRLSQGQKQLISFARAIIADPKILILDEATSSIDVMTEKIVKDGLNKLMNDKTTIIIAHRLSTIEDADLILVMKNGKIIERGTHDELVNMKGEYYGLYNGDIELS